MRPNIFSGKNLPSPYYETELGKLYCADCMTILPHLEPADAVITDPPYGLSFILGRDWDHNVPGKRVWEAIQTKPGAFMLAFGGTRTFHRLAVAIEDAGWEIRDCISWLYSNGFPKSLDISKAIDDAAGAKREIVSTIKTNKIRSGIVYAGRCGTTYITYNITAPATAAAREWSGWGTALKPAWEPIIVARRPLIGTVTENVLTHGTGGINVDRCRINMGEQPNKMGRWPANVIHDGSDEVLAAFPVTTRQRKERISVKGGCKGALGNFAGSTPEAVGIWPADEGGSAARFFYVAKASKRDRGKYNTHPTVKPFKLIRYLTRLISRRGALVVDPFAGSGTLAVVCERIKRRWICIEINEEYCEIAKKRIEDERKQLHIF